MSIFLEIIICVVVLFFPLMIYSYYVLYKKNYKEKEKTIILDLTLFITLFLITNLVNYCNSNIFYIFVIIPVFFSYIYKRKLCTFIISAIVSFYILSLININIMFLLLVNILYLIFFIIYIRSNKSINFLVFSFCISTIIVLSIFLFVKNGVSFLNKEYFYIIVLFFFMMNLIIFAYKKTNEIVNLYMTLNDLKQDKNLKVSLFKITHEIKNPLTVVNGYLQMYDINDKEKSKKYLSIIESEVKRMLNLLDDFNEFTKIKVIKEKSSFNKLIEEVKETIIPLSKKKKIEVIFEIENNLYINMDKNRIKQVLINIIKNGIEACDNYGKVIITSYNDEKNLYIFVKDNGIGMDKDTMDNILKPFYTTKCNGTGLGVSLSNEIVLAHGGILEFSSKKNCESIFKIILPL